MPVPMFTDKRDAIKAIEKQWDELTTQEQDAVAAKVQMYPGGPWKNALASIGFMYLRDSNRPDLFKSGSNAKG